jgi:hypothetical protein
MESNNFAAGWVDFNDAGHWTIGGSTVPKGNIMIGARVGFWIRTGTTFAVQRNYADHVYFGGWSQGSVFEYGSITSVLAEHNVIVNSSWPNRGMSGEFRYNLVLGLGSEEGLVWNGAADGALVHHNVFRGWENAIRGIVYIVAPNTITVRNNTFDAVNKDQSGGGPCIHQVASTTSTANSNLFLNCPANGVKIDAGSITTDYNAFWTSNTPFYSDARTPAHDVSADPKMTSPPTANKPYVEATVWTRVDHRRRHPRRVPDQLHAAGRQLSARRRRHGGLRRGQRHRRDRGDGRRASSDQFGRP